MQLQIRLLHPGGCASDFSSSSVIVNPLPVVTFTGLSTSYYYNNPSVDLIGNPSGGVFSGTGISDTLFSPSKAGAGTFPITYSYTDGNGCTNTSQIQSTIVLAQPAPPHICAVTVDSMSKYNIVFWDNTQYANVDTFIVYRETGSSYQRVGAVPGYELSQFIDTARQLYFPNTGDPNAGTYRYKLQIRDSLGNYSPLSPFHNTIFINQTNATFTWNPYEIEGMPVPLPPNVLFSYDLWRDDLSNGNWHLVNSVSGSQLTQTDIEWTSGLEKTASWRIETNWSLSCTPTTARLSAATTGYNTSKSNIRNSDDAINSGIAAAQKFEQGISLFPNPTNNELNVGIPGGFSTYHLSIYNSLGSVVFVRDIKGNSAVNANLSEKIDVTDFAAGIYFLSLQTETLNVLKKLVVQ